MADPWVLAVVIVTAAAVVQGMTGFGFGIFSMPLLILVYGPHHAVIIVLALGSLAGALMAVQLRRDIDLSSLARYLAIGLCAMPVGIAVFHSLDAAAMQLAVGATVTIVALTMLLGSRLRFGESRWAEYGSVFAGGAMTAAIGMGATPVVLYAALTRIEKTRFRVTLTAYGVTVSIAALAALWLSGAATWDDALDSLRLVIGLMLGLPLGLWLHSRVSDRGFDRVVLSILLVMGLGSIGRAL